MAQQVGKGFTVHLTASLRAGTKALEELCSQGHISTTNWYNLEVEPINNNGINSSTTRILIFMLENEQKIEVMVMAWKKDPEDVVDGDRKRQWMPVHVCVEKDRVMLAFENNVNQKGYPWSRQPGFDKLLF